MASVYPGSLDTFGTSHADSVGEIIHASTVNDIADATNKIEAELGINPSGSYADVATALAAASGAATVGLLTSRPSASTNSGHQYYATDDVTDGPHGTLYISDGTAWRMVPRTMLGTMGWVDARDYGQVADLKRGGNGSISSGSGTFTGTGYLGSNGEAGKLVMVAGAGATLLTNTDGSMNSAASPTRDKNILTGSGFTRSLVGRFITITGVGTAGATLSGFVWGVIDSTHLRVNFNCVTTASSQTYTISEDLYATCTASTTTTLTLNTNAGTTVSSAENWLGTDDAPAIQAAITAAEGVVGSGNGYTVWLKPGPSAIGSTLLQTKPGVLQGSGSPGYSGLIGHGTTRFHAMKSKMTVLAYRTSGAGMGVRGSMTASSGVLTDPDGSFVPGDVGKAVYVRGAGTQAGSDTLDYLITTIASYTSATSVTLTASAVNTVVDQIYSYGVGFALLTGPTLNNVHIEGRPDSKCGLHAMNLCGWSLRQVTISGFKGGVCLYSDRASGFNSTVTCEDLQLTDSFQHLCCWGTGMTFNGNTNIDGFSNAVQFMPGPGTIGIIAVNSALYGTGGLLNIQAVETWGRFEGSGHQYLVGCRGECVPLGLIITTDNIQGAKGSWFSFTSWSNSTVGGTSSNKGLQLQSLVTDIRFDPGFYITSDLDMYGGSDATALLNSVITDPIGLSASYVSYPITIARTSDSTAVNNSTTLVDDGVLQFTATASGLYRFELMLLLLGDATMDAKLSISASGSPTICQWGVDGQPNLTGWAPVVTTTTALGLQGTGGTVLIGGASAVRYGVKISGIVQASGSNSLVKLQFAQNTAEVADLNIKTGSHLMYWKLA